MLLYTIYRKCCRSNYLKLGTFSAAAITRESNSIFSRAAAMAAARDPLPRTQVTQNRQCPNPNPNLDIYGLPPRGPGPVFRPGPRPWPRPGSPTRGPGKNSCVLSATRARPRARFRVSPRPPAMAAAREGFFCEYGRNFPTQKCDFEPNELD